MGQALQEGGLAPTRCSLRDLRSSKFTVRGIQNKPVCCPCTDNPFHPWNANANVYNAAIGASKKLIVVADSQSVHDICPNKPRWIFQTYLRRSSCIASTYQSTRFRANRFLVFLRRPLFRRHCFDPPVYESDTMQSTRPLLQ